MKSDFDTVSFEIINTCINKDFQVNVWIKTKNMKFTKEFIKLPTPLTCFNGLRYMLTFNMPLVFYRPLANVYPAEAREQGYHVTNFDMVKFNMYGKLT